MTLHSATLAALLAASIFIYVLLVGTSASSTTALPLQKHCRSLCTQVEAMLRRLLVRVIRQGPIPQHVAFIMDGNRRFARKSNMATVRGHVSGFFRLASVLEWCNDLGIRHVSVFAFAINNFNRSEEEVSALMELAKDKLRELAEKSELVRKHGVRIRVIGNRQLLGADVLEAVDFAEQQTRDNRGMTLNICFAYSATDEITSAIRRVVEDAENGKLEISDIDEKALESRLQIPEPGLDILVRTSGQIRFSNYMLWQTSKMAYIQFVDAFWPDFSFFHMFRIVISWQRAARTISRRKQMSQRSTHAIASGGRSTRMSTAQFVSDDETCCSDRG